MSIVAAELVARVTADVSQAERELKGFSQRMGSMTGGVFSGNMLTGAVQGIGRGLADLGRIGVGAFTDMMSSGMDFTAQMDGVAAVLGGTQEQAAALGQLAIDLAINPNLKVDATEAAMAIQNLATAGLSANEILGGATEATILLANATGGDFGQAATVATDVMSLFGIKAEDMMGAVNGISAVSNVSKFDLNDYALAIAQAGGVASMSGVSFDDFNATIAAISPAFASGSDAGTSFKTFLQRLNPTTDEAIELMGELNLLSADGTSIFYDSAGALKDMDDIVAIMNDTFGDMTESQKSFYMGQLFGTDAMRAAGQIASMTQDEYQMLLETMSENDALEAAAVRTDNFKSAWENLGGAIEAVKIQMFTALEPAAQKLTEALSPVIDWAQPKLVQMAEDLGAWLTEKIPAVEIAIKTAYDESGGSITAAAIAGIAELMGLTDELRSFQTLWNAVWSTVSSVVSTAWAVVEPYFTTMTTWLTNTAIAALSGLQNAFSAAWIALPALVVGAWGIIEPYWNNITSWLQTNIVSALQGFQTTFMTVWNAIPAVAAQAWATIQGYWNSMVSWLQNDSLAALQGFQSIFMSAWNTIGGYVSAAWTVIQPYWNAIASWLKTEGVAALQTFRATVSAVWTAIPGFISSAWTMMQTSLTAMKTWFTTDGVTALSGLQTTFQTVWAALPALVSTAVAAIQTAWTAIETYFGPSIERIKTAIGGLATGFAPVTAALPGLQEAFVNLGIAVMPVLQFLGSAVTVLAVAFANTLAPAISAIGPIITVVVKQVTLAINSIAAVVESSVALIQAIIDGDWAALWTAARDIAIGMLTFVVGTIENSVSVVGILFGVLYDTVIGTLTDLGVDVEAVLLYIKAKWDEIWTSFSSAVAAVEGAVTGVRDAIAGFVTWIGGISIPNPFAALADSMREVQAGLPGAGPAPAGTRRQYLPTGGWVDLPLEGNATGNPMFRGGLTWVGERGPELVALPRASRIYSNQDSMGMMGGAMVVNNYNTVTQPHHIELIAQRVAAHMARKGR